MRNNKSFFPITCMLTSIGLVGITGCSEQEPQNNQIEHIRPIKALQVGEHVSALGSMTLPGKARSIQEVDLAFDVTGTIAERDVEVGDVLKKGDVIARLDQRRFIAELKAAKAELANATANYKRAKELVSKGFVSKAEYDVLEAQKAVAESAVDLAQKALKDTYIRAPFDGVVSSLYVENYTAVQAKQRVARLLDNSKMEFVLNLSEQYIPLVDKVINPRVRFDIYPDVEFKLTIKEIGTEASESSRTYPVVYTLEQIEGAEVLPGMSGIAMSDGIEGINQGHIVVPPSSVFSTGEDSQSFVWVVDSDSNTISKQKVDVDKLTESGMVISSGIEPGEWIAVAGVNYLKDGQEVRVLDSGTQE